MKKDPGSSAELATALSATDPERRRSVLKTLFEDVALRKRAAAYVRLKGGNRQDSEDVFQEAIIVLDRKLRRFDFVVESSLEAYFIGIVRWCWFNECLRRRKTGAFSSEEAPEPPAGGNPEVEFLLNEQREQLGKLLEKLQEKCCKILKM